MQSEIVRPIPSQSEKVRKFFMKSENFLWSPKIYHRIRKFVIESENFSRTPKIKKKIRSDSVGPFGLFWTKLTFRTRNPVGSDRTPVGSDRTRSDPIGSDRIPKNMKKNWKNLFSDSDRNPFGSDRSLSD